MYSLEQPKLIRTRRLRAFMQESSVWLATIAAVALTLSSATFGQAVQAAEPQPGRIVGTVTDVNNSTVPSATVVLDGSDTNDHRSLLSNDNGYFEFQDVKPGTTYQLSVRADGFADWISPAVMVEPGQFKIITNIQLLLATEFTTVQVTYDPVQIATEQVRNAEKQRILGFVPNFYVVYDPDPAPLTARMKFKLALKVSSDPVSLAGIAFLSGIQQAGDTPAYGQGAQGFGKRLGANAAGAFSDIMIGGAILPSLLHQDPRYFYQGTGTTSSRIRHAMFNPFVCKSDNGKWQPNYSSLGGDLATSALANAYYPKSNRGAGMLLTHFAIDTGERILASFAQEFLLRGITHRAGSTK